MSAEPRTTTVTELDGVRGIAILLVLLFHFSARPHGVPTLVTAPFALGWTGVDLFFVLSGFLITGILLDSKGAENYFSSFYVRRLLRIFPLYLLSVIAYFWFALPAAHYFGYWRGWDRTLEPWFWSHLSNWKSAFGQDVTLLTHFWSLAIEEQFYLLWPFVVFLASKRALVYICVVTIASSFLLRCIFSSYTALYPEFLYRLTPFRLEPLAYGALVTLLVRNDLWRRRLDQLLYPAAAVAVLGIVALFATTRTPAVSNRLVSTVGFSAFSLLYALVVFFAYTRRGSDTRLAKVFRSPLLVSCGVYSYAMYLFHFPLSYYANALIPVVAERTPHSLLFGLWALSKGSGVVLSYLLAYASWHLIERRFLSLKPRFRVRWAPVRVIV